MLVLAFIWLIAGLLLGFFVPRRSLALCLTLALGAVPMLTIAVRTGPPGTIDPELAVVVVVTLMLAMVGTLLGSLARNRRVVPVIHAE